MKTNNAAKTFKSSISLTVEPTDTIAWKFTMLLEAALADEESIDKIARRYGYTREHFYKIKKQYEEGGCLSLTDKSKGPKINYKRTDEIEKQIIRHRFLDPEANSEVIAQKMNQTGHVISQRSVERTINAYGLQKKGYIKQLRKMRESK
jgi:transposase